MPPVAGPTDTASLSRHYYDLMQAGPAPRERVVRHKSVYFASSPTFEAILEAITGLEKSINASSLQAAPPVPEQLICL